MTSKTRARHKFFENETTAFNPDAILIPDNALALRNNCKEGRWMLGDTSYGDRLKIVALKFSRYLHKGNDVLAPGTPIGQLWFVPIDGGKGTDEHGNENQLALNLVYYTVLKNSKSNKSGSLLNFGQKAAQLQANGYDYREVVWTPRFVKKTATITNDLGQPEGASWFVLDFNCTLPEQQDNATYNKIGNIINILSNPNEMSKLLDPIMLKEHEPVDHLSTQEVMQLARSMSSMLTESNSSNNGNEKALSAAVNPPF